MNLIPDGQGFSQVFRAWEDSAPLEGGDSSKFDGGGLSQYLGKKGGEA